MPEGPQGRRQSRETLALAEELGIGAQPRPAVGLQLLGDVEVARAPLLPGGDQQVGEPIEIHVEEGRRPGPVGGRDPRHGRHLREGAVGSLEEERVRVVLGLRPRIGRIDGHRGRSVQQGQPTHRIRTEHVEHREIPPPVLVEVGEVHAHREEAGVPQESGRGLAEPDLPGLALVEPQPVGRLEVVADVEVGFSVTIEVAELGRQAPFERGM